MSTQIRRVPSAFRILRKPEDENAHEEWLEENADFLREREARRILRVIEDRKMQRLYGSNYLDWRICGF